MKRVIITGANGFLGLHLVNYFTDQKHEVHAWVRSASSTSRLSRLLPEEQIHRMDYENIAGQKEVLSAIQPDVVIHCAGVTVAGRTDDYFTGNVRTTEYLLTALESHPPKKFVHISSLAARGPGIDSHDQPVSAYGRSKLEAEQTVIASGLDWAIIRPTAIYGPGDKAFAPLFQWASRGVLPSLGRLDRQLTLVHVQDVCRLVEAETKQTTSRLVYAWDGRNYRQTDVIETLREVFGGGGLHVPIPAALFRLGTSVPDFLLRQLMGLPWAYTPEKCKELLAQDWGIPEEEQPDLPLISLDEGFKAVQKSYLE